MNSFISEKFTIEPVSNIDHIERSFCTNFSCCNILLPDLHALFAHYDTQHLPQLLPPKYLPPPALHLDLSSDESDSCSTSPSSSIPSTPSTPHHILSSTPPKIALSLYHNPFSEAEHEDVPLFDDSYLIPEYPTYEQCYNAAIAPPGSPFSFSPSSSTLSSPTSATFPLPVTDSFYPPPSPPSGSNLPEQPSDPGATCTTLLSATEIQSQPQIPHSSASTSPANSAPGSPYSRPTGVGGSHYKKPRDREKKSSAAKYLGRKKLYTCPTPGCSKVYLNPNGLKYHQEKGRCKIEDASEAAAMDVSPTAAASPVVAEPPSPLSIVTTPASSSPPTPILSQQQNGTAQSQPQLAYHPLYFALPVFQPPKPVAKPESQDAASSLPQEASPSQLLFQPQPLQYTPAATSTTEMTLQSEVVSSSASC